MVSPQLQPDSQTAALFGSNTRPCSPTYCIYFIMYFNTYFIVYFIVYLENNTSLTLLHDLDHCSLPPLLPGLLLGSSERARGGICNSMMSFATRPEKRMLSFARITFPPSPPNSGYLNNFFTRQKQLVRKYQKIGTRLAPTPISKKAFFVVVFPDRNQLLM